MLTVFQGDCLPLVENVITTVKFIDRVRRYYQSDKAPASRRPWRLSVSFAVSPFRRDTEVGMPGLGHFLFHHDPSAKPMAVP